MTYEEFKKLGYTIEAVGYATVWSEVEIDEVIPKANSSARYNLNTYEIEYQNTDYYRIVSSNGHDVDEEFHSIEDVEEYIKNKM